jgi:hypothetical protein
MPVTQNVSDEKSAADESTKPVPLVDTENPPPPLSYLVTDICPELYGPRVNNHESEAFSS